jgi:epoxyqueuosine reductase QueG
MNETTREVRKLAREVGTDLIGICSASRLQKAPKGHKPTDILPTARSVIVIAIRMLDSAVETLPSPIYQCASYVTLNDELNRAAFLIAKFLEDRGYSAVPIPATRDYAIDLTGTFSHRHAAVAAGLGEIGLSGLLITPQYGPRVRLTSIITDAELECDVPFQDKLCTKCLRCVQECPVGALSEDGSMDKLKCLTHPHVLIGDSQEKIQQIIQKLKKIPRDLFVAEALVGQRIIAPLCGMCVKVCPIGKKTKKRQT